MRVFGVFAALLLVAGCKSRSDAGATPGAGGAGADAAAAARQDSSAAWENTTSGALQVMSVSSPVDWFLVYQDSTRITRGNPPLLNATVELPPGEYQVDVNHSRRPVTITAGRKTIVWTGDLVVEGGSPSDFFMPMQNGERRFTSNPPIVGRPVPLFPGSYTAIVHGSVSVPPDTLGPATVVAGTTTTLRH